MSESMSPFRRAKLLGQSYNSEVFKINPLIESSKDKRQPNLNDSMTKAHQQLEFNPVASVANLPAISEERTIVDNLEIFEANQDKLQSEAEIAPSCFKIPSI